MEHTSAYQIGQAIGIIFFLFFALGIVVFFVVSLVKAINIRRTGWIVAAAVSSLPIICFVVLVGVGFAIGFTKGIEQSREIAAAKRGEPSALLSAVMSPVTGNTVAYNISLPWAADWRKNQDHPPFDYLFNYRDAYLGTIVEGIGVGTPEHICEIAQKNLSAKASDASFTTPQTINIDSHSWLTYDATATVQGIHIKYRFYVYADDNNTVQLISWTGPALFDHYAPVFDRIAKSFKMPQ